MAAEGKHSPFTLRTLTYSVGSFLAAWGATKLLDTYFDTTLLATVRSWLLVFWDWMLLTSPLQNWSVMALAALLLYSFWTVAYYHRTSSNIFFELHKAEDVIHKLRNPEPPPLNRSHINIMQSIARMAETGIHPSLLLFSTGSGMSQLQVEVIIEQLAAMGFVHTQNTESPTRQSTPQLTLKGKEYVLNLRSKNAKDAKQADNTKIS